MNKITRRRFVSNTAEGLVAAGAVAAIAQPAHSASANETLQVAMIGMGGRSRSFVSELKRQQNVVVTTVCDLDEGRAARGAETIEKALGRKPKQSHDYRRVIDDKSIDVVIVATPHHWHTPIALPAIEAGKDVYIEKPAAHVFREGRLLVDAARKHERIVQHGTQMRSSLVTAKAREILDSGIIGEVKMTKAWNVQRHSHRNKIADSTAPAGVNYDMWLDPAAERPFNANRFHGNWQWYRDFGNGDIGNDGIHDIDMARFGLGVSTHPVRITAHGSRIDLVGEREYPDNMMVAYHYEEGKVLLYEDRGWSPCGIYGFDSGNAFYGTEGEMIFTRRGYFQVYLGRGRKKGPTFRGDTGMSRHIDNFFESIRTRKPTNASAEVAHLSCGLVHLGEIAYRTGRVLHFDPQSESFKDDREADSLLTKDYRQPWSVRDTTSS